MESDECVCISRINSLAASYYDQMIAAESHPLYAYYDRAEWELFQDITHWYGALTENCLRRQTLKRIRSIKPILSGASQWAVRKPIFPARLFESSSEAAHKQLSVTSWWQKHDDVIITISFYSDATKSCFRFVCESRKKAITK